MQQLVDVAKELDQHRPVKTVGPVEGVDRRRRGPITEQRPTRRRRQGVQHHESEKRDAENDDQRGQPASDQVRGHCVRMCRYLVLLTRGDAMILTSCS